MLEDEDYTYAYDTKGNRISKTAKTGGEVETYSYDSQNRLVGYASPTTTATYAYDAMDRRVAKTVDGVVTAFVYDSWGLNSTASDVLLDFENGSLTKRWLHGIRVDEPLGFEVYSGSAASGSGAAHEVFADRLGSVLSVIETATSTVVASNEYDSFGNRSPSGILSQRYGFTGREYDVESGLIYYRARTYDPAVGMFLQRDPIGFAGQTRNLYEYVKNDPFGMVDPTGLYLNHAQYQQLLSAARSNAAPVATVASAATSLGTRISQVIAMGATVQLTGDSQQNNNDDCQKLYGQINFTVNVLRTRFNEFVTDPLSLPDIGKMSKETHVRSYEQAQKRLRKLLKKAHRKGCLMYHPSAPYWAENILPWFRE